MSLLVPDSGLLFWMVLSFGIVFFVLAKYGFPIIVRRVDERKQYIDQSLAMAKEAREQLAHIRQEADKILAQARAEQSLILKEATDAREKIIREGKMQARLQGEKWLDEVRRQIALEKEEAIRDIRRQVAVLSVDIAQKVLRKNLDTDAKQMDIINRMLDEWMITSKN